MCAHSSLTDASRCTTRCLLLSQARLRLHGPAMKRLQGLLDEGRLADALPPAHLAAVARSLGRMRTALAGTVSQV